MRRLNVAIVVESLHSQGGVGRRTSELVRKLLSAGHEVHVYANRWDPKAAEGASFHYIPMLKLGRAAKPLSFAWFCSALIPRSRHDLIHTQARVFRYDVATLGVGCHRAYLDAVGIDPEKAPDRRLHRTILHIERSMLASERFAAQRRIIVNSNKCKGELVDYYSVPETSIDVARNGVDHGVFSPDIRASLGPTVRRELGMSPDELMVLFVGSGFQRKGLDTLIEAVGRLRRGRSLRLFVVGRGKRDEHSRLAADVGIAEQLTWIGQSDPSDIVKYYAAADIFALPTRYDPFANSTMEALACGVPVVTTNANGVSEILRDGTDGLIVEPDEADALSERLRALADDADFRTRLGSNGRVAVEPYTWSKTAERTAAVYETIMAKRSQQ